jgi:cobalamin biosynthesis protein CobT
LKVKENARYKFNRERGAINARALAQVYSSDSFRTPFKEFGKTDTTNVAVTLVIDQSGSMRGEPIEVARQTALAIGESLAAINIRFEMVGFYTEDDRRLADIASKLTAKDNARFNRFGTKLKLQIFKSFDTVSLNGITQCISSGANADGESILWAAKRLALRKEKRKIMLVFSDGQPAYGGADHATLAGDLKRVIRMLPKAGIEPIGFGIQTEDVKLFYPDYVIVEDLKQLPTKVMGKVAKILEEGFKRK